MLLSSNTFKNSHMCVCPVTSWIHLHKAVLGINETFLKAKMCIHMYVFVC